MKKLTVTVLLMLVMTLSIASPTNEEVALLEELLNKESAAAEAISGTHTPLKETLKPGSEVGDKAIPSFRHRKDGIALFAKNDVATLNQVMTSNPLYALIALLNSQIPHLVQAAEYVTLLDALTKTNQTLNVLLAEAKAGNERLAAIHEALTQEA